MTKEEIKRKYNLPSYRGWSEVPKHLFTRTAALREKVVIPAEAKPDAIKNAASVFDKDKIYFLFDINKYKNDSI